MKIFFKRRSVTPRVRQKGAALVWLVLVLVILIAAAYYLEKMNLIPSANTSYFTWFPSGPASTSTDAVADWTGTYSFDEQGQSPRSNIRYVMYVSKDSNYNYSLLLNVDGPNVVERINGNGEANGGKFVVRFDSFRPGDNPIQFHLNDWLFSLQPIDAKNFTVIWGIMKPNLITTELENVTASRID